MFLVVALVVDKPDAAVELLPHQRDVLLLGLLAVGAGGAEDEDVLIGDADPVEPFHQNGQIGTGLLPAAGDVRDDNADLIPRLNGLLEGARADRVIQRILDMLPHRALGQIHGIGADFRHHLLRVQRHLECGVTVFHTFHVIHLL